MADFPEKNLIRQIKCPSVAKDHYGLLEGIYATFAEHMPESLGYIFGYGFTGQGDYNKGNGWNNIGLFQSKKDRVLGTNFFQKTDKLCDTSSVPNCVNQDQYMYIKNYPVTEGGLITFGLMEDMVEMNPVTLMNAAIGKGNFSSKCEEIEMPVGNTLLDSGYKYANQADYTNKATKCLNSCEHKRFSTDTELDNCKKACTRGWWVEKKCIPRPVGYDVVYGGHKYTVPSGMKDIKNLVTPSVEKFSTREEELLLDSQRVTDEIQKNVFIFLTACAAMGLGTLLFKRKYLKA